MIIVIRTMTIALIQFGLANEFFENMDASALYAVCKGPVVVKTSGVAFYNEPVVVNLKYIATGQRPLQFAFGALLSMLL